MGCDASDGGKTEVGEAGSPVLIDQDVRLRRRVRGTWMLYWRETYTPFRSP